MIKRVVIGFFIIVIILAGFFRVDSVDDIFLNISGDFEDEQLIIEIVDKIVGKNVFAINYIGLIRKLESSKYIRKAYVYPRGLKEVVVQIDAKSPLLTVIYRGAQIVIDEDEFVYSIEQRYVNLPYPTLKLLTIDHPLVGERVTANDHRLLQKGLEIANIIKEANLQTRVREIGFVEDGLILKVKDDFVVAIDKLDNLLYKVSFLEQILYKLDDEGIVRGDIIFYGDSNPFYKPFKE